MSKNIDPFCGSGTILIESALYALHIAPGINRSFAAERWRQISPRLWKEGREQAREEIRRDAAFFGRGYDIDPAAVELAQENAQKAGVSSWVQVQQKDIREFEMLSPRGCVVCNPPYGERLLDLRQAREIYEEMGKVFQRTRGWNYTVISPDEEFERFFGRPADRRRKLYNGMIQCQVYQFYK
jgi:putative N6-adenine-specific DNA methylase